MEAERGRGRGRRPSNDYSEWLTFPGGESREVKPLTGSWQLESEETLRTARFEEEYDVPIRLYDARIHQNLNYTSNVGERGGDILRAEMKQSRDEIMSRAAIRDLLLSMDPKDLTIVVIHMSMGLVSRGALFVPAEIGLTAFSIQGGIIDNYWSLIDPYHVPMGFGFTVRETCKDLGLPCPPYSNRFQEYGKIITGLEGFLKKHENPVTKTSIAFCLKKDVHPFNSALDWLYDQIGQEHKIELGLIGDIVHPLSDIGITRRAQRENIEASILFAKYLNHTQFFLIEDMPKDLHKTIPSPTSIVETYESSSSGYASNPLTDEGVIPMPPLYKRKLGYFRYLPMKGLDTGGDNQNRILHPERGYHNGKEVEEYLESQELSFDSEIACLYHMQPNHENRMRFCPLHVTNRFAYCILASLIGHFGVDPVLPGVHKYVRGTRLREEKLGILGMIKKWGCNFRECVEFSYDGKPPPLFSTRMSDELHPRTYRPE